MKCPKCKKDLLCGCKPCIKNNSKKIDKNTSLIVWKTGETQICCSCGFENHCDFWLNQEEKQTTAFDNDIKWIQKI